MRVKIGDFLKPVRNSIIVQPDVEYKQVTIRMNNQGVCLRGIKKGIDIKTKRQFLVEPGQFILSKIDARNGAFGLVPEDLDGAIVTQDFPTYSINHQIIDKDYLVFLSSSEFFVDLMKKSSSGTTNRKRLKEERFLNIEIELPNIDTQRNTTKLLFATLSQLKKIEVKIGRLRIEDYSSKIYWHVLREKIKDDYTLADFANITMGQSPDGSLYNKVRNGLPLINGPTEFTLGDFGKTKTYQYCSATKSKLCNPNDTLLCVRGSSTGRINIASEKAIIGRGIAAISPKIQSGDNSLLTHLFLVTQKRVLFRKGKGTTFPNITKEDLHSLPFPYIEDREKKKIIYTLSNIHKLITEISILNAKLANCHRLLNKKITNSL